MNQGDIVICGVSADVVIEDIAFNAPRGVAVTVPGELAQKSKDLWRYLSQGVLFKCDVSNILRSVQAARPAEASPTSNQSDMLQGKITDLQGQIAVLQSHLAKAQASSAQLEADLGRAQAENARLRGELIEERSKNGQLGKIDDILLLLKQAPLRSGFVSIPSSTRDSSVDDSAPSFIPSQIKPEAAIEVAVSVQEARSDGGSVSGAANALRKARRGGQ